MFLCVYKKQLCEFAICGKITENQERMLEAIDDIKESAIDLFHGVKEDVDDFLSDTHDSVNNLCTDARTFISKTDKKLDKISNNVNDFIDKQQEELEKTEKLLQIVLIALACLVVVGVIALIWNAIAKSRRQNRQNEILEQISSNMKNNNANYNTNVGMVPVVDL